MHVTGEGFMSETETAEVIDQRAALWAARLDRAPLTETERKELDAWIGGDTRRLGAFARARAVAVHSRRAVALGEAPCASAQPPVASRRALLAASVAVVSLGGAGLAAAYWRRSQRLETMRGEIRSVVLDDGSIVSLNTLSRVSVRFSRDVREVVMMFGEVLFEVAGADRPFVIRAAGATMTTQTGLFLLKRLDQSPLQITTLKGALNIVSGRHQKLELAENRTLAVGGFAVQHALQPGRVDDRRAQGLLAWREGKVAFHDDTLAAAAAEFSRFRGAPIQFDGEQIAQMRITGLFEANDSAAFARAVAHSLNLRAEIGPERILLSKA